MRREGARYGVPRRVRGNELCEGSLQQGSYLSDAFDDCPLGEVSKSEDQVGWGGGSGGAVGAHP